jgi:hypothetical protein
MINTPTKEELLKIPKLYSSEHTPIEDKIIYMHFSIYFGNAGMDWWIAEYSQEENIFFGFANHNDPESAEWGYVSFEELKSIKIGGALELERDLNWIPKKVSQIEGIRNILIKELKDKGVGS